MRRLVLVALLLQCFSALADDAIVPVKKWTLLDQNDKAYTLDDDAQVLLVARSMAAAKLVNAAIEDSPAGYLEARHMIYVADIEKMPSWSRWWPCQRCALPDTGSCWTVMAGSPVSTRATVIRFNG